MNFVGPIGSKASVAPYLIGCLPPEAKTFFLEVFSGSVAVSLAMDLARVHVVNDLDSHITGMFRAVKKLLNVFLKNSMTFACLIFKSIKKKGLRSLRLSKMQAGTCLSYEADRGWFLECGYLEGNKSRAIRTQVNALCREVSACAEDLVASFGIPEALLPELVQQSHE